MVTMRRGIISTVARMGLLVLALVALGSAQNQTKETSPVTTPAPAPPAPPPSPPAAPTCPEGTLEGCRCDVQCCTPGTLQLGDNPDSLDTSFCTDKPFQEEYKMRIYDRVPVQINLRSYCTDEILFSAYTSPKVDQFQLVEFGCTYRASDCKRIADPIRQEECDKQFDVYTKELNCTGKDSFFEQFVKERICNRENQKKTREWFYNEGHDAYGVDVPATIGACNCNFSSAIMQATGKMVKGTRFAEDDVKKLTTGVPDGFIKDGMSTFYIELVLGGRSTAERGADKSCQCASPLDKSEACLCELGSKKIPYVYNNSFVPHLTALVSMKNGQLYYTNTGVQWNFDQAGSTCSGCSPDYCYGVPRAQDPDDPNDLGFPETWRRQDFDLKIQQASVCAVPMEPPQYWPEYYCPMPSAKDEVNRCSLKIYMAWSGTDRYGSALETSNMMFSKFTQMGVGNIAAQFLASGGSMYRKIDSRISG